MEARRSWHEVQKGLKTFREHVRDFTAAMTTVSSFVPVCEKKKAVKFLLGLRDGMQKVFRYDAQACGAFQF